MINIFKKIIQFKLKWLAKIYLWRVKPRVIVISGTTGRHWIKEAAKEALEKKNFLVRTSKKNFNAEIGLPLSILGLSSNTANFFEWQKILWQALKTSLGQRRFKEGSNEPDYLVLEVAIDAPEDMSYLVGIIKPNIVILTTITMICAENFENLDEIGKEYEELIKALPWNGILVLNNDDLRIKELKKHFDGNVVTFGFSSDSQYKAVDVFKISDGQSFKIEIQRKEKNFLDTKINRFGKHHIYAELIKAVIGDNFKERQKDFFGKILE